LGKHTTASGAPPPSLSQAAIEHGACFREHDEPDLYGFTSDRSGNNLPPRGEWKYFKTIDMAVGETPRWGVSTEKALEAIEKDGFYLTTGQIRLEEREG
jgi:hypothetical protein